MLNSGQSQGEVTIATAAYIAAGAAIGTRSGRRLHKMRTGRKGLSGGCRLCIGLEHHWGVGQGTVKGEVRCGGEVAEGGG